MEQWAQLRAGERQRFTDRVAEAVGKSPAAVAETFSRGVFMSAPEALDFGLLDEICRPKGAIHQMPGPPIGFRPRSLTSGFGSVEADGGPTLQVGSSGLARGGELEVDQSLPVDLPLRRHGPGVRDDVARPRLLAELDLEATHRRPHPASR